MFEIGTTLYTRFYGLRINSNENVFIIYIYIYVYTRVRTIPVPRPMPDTIGPPTMPIPDVTS